MDHMNQEPADFAAARELLWLARAEIERLRHDLDRAMSNHSADINAAPPEDALRDAARYRWMREHDWDSPIVKLGYDDYETAKREELDRAVDAEMQSPPQRDRGSDA